MINRKIDFMEDLIAIQGKSVAELREIAKVLGITDEKLSKKELLAKITEFATATNNNATEEATPAEVATEKVAPAPQKRKRARLGSVKVESVKATDTADKESGAENKEAATAIATIAESESNESNEAVAPQPKKRGRKPKGASEAPQTSESAEVAKAEPQQPEQAQEEKQDEKQDKPITKDDFKAEVYGEGVSR